MLSKVIKALLEQAPVPVSCFFLGIVIGGIPALLKKAKSGDQISRFSSVEVPDQSTSRLPVYTPPHLNFIASPV